MYYTWADKWIPWENFTKSTGALCVSCSLFVSGVTGVDTYTVTRCVVGGKTNMGVHDMLAGDIWHHKRKPIDNLLCVMCFIIQKCLIYLSYEYLHNLKYWRIIWIAELSEFVIWRFKGFVTPNKPWQIKCLWRLNTVYKSPFPGGTISCHDPNKVDCVWCWVRTSHESFTPNRTSGTDTDRTPGPRYPEFIEKRFAQGTSIVIDTFSSSYCEPDERFAVSETSDYNFIMSSTRWAIFTSKSQRYIMFCASSERDVGSIHGNETVGRQTIIHNVIWCCSANFRRCWKF